MASDLISRAELIARIDKCVGLDGIGLEPVMAIRDVKALVSVLPAVDAAPVVRCRDCKYAHLTYDGECKYCDFWQEDGGEALYLDGDFYCAAGERKDGGDT